MSTEPQEPRQEAAFFTTIRGWGIVRGDNGVLGGVIEGVGTRIGMDRVPARLLTVVLAIFLFPPTIVAYAAAWALLPDSSGNIIIQNFGRGRPNVGALIGIGIMTLVGLGSFDEPVTFHVGEGWFPFGNIIGAIVVLGVLGFIAWLILRNRGDASKGYATPPRSPNTETYATPPSGAFATPPAAAAASGTSGSARTSGAAKASSASATAPAPAATRTPAPPAPPRLAPKPRIPGPGAVIYLLTLAATLLAAAAVWWLDRTSQLPVSPAAAFFAALVIIVGVAIILAGAAGRKIGFLGFMATTLIIGWVVALSAPGATGWFNEHVHLSFNDISIDAGGLSDEELRGAAFACSGFDLQAATEVSDSPDERIEVSSGETVSTFGGNVVVTVPDDARVTVALTGDPGSTATVMWGSQGLSCALTGPSDQITIGTGADEVTVLATADTTAIVIEGN